MAQIAYILLCHKNVEAIIAQAEYLTAEGDAVAIHFDKNAPALAYQKLRQRLEDNPNVTFARRIRCGWGEWSLVEATLETLKSAVAAFPDAQHFYLISGDCMPIKSAEYIHDYLTHSNHDFIESVDFFTSNWIRTGFCEERLIYRHWFNERSQAWLFYTSYHLQSKLGLRRKIPDDLQMMIGSQWWCLRRKTVGDILEFISKRPDVVKFFRTTWIPDETFFQTLVRHMVPSNEITSKPPTFLLFSDYGMPINFYNDQKDLLLAQDHLFARKISVEATDLQQQLVSLYGAKGQDFPISDQGRRLFQFLTGRGRIGERFAPRFWEKNAMIGRDRTLYVVVCKKWHVAKRVAARMTEGSTLTKLEYMFDEATCPLPDLGGIEANLEKRGRHRRAFIRMLFECADTDQLMFCLDPANLDLLKDLHADTCDVRILEIECAYTDDYLAGHAQRVGLVGDQPVPGIADTLLSAIRNDIAHESERIRDQNFPGFYLLRERLSPEENAGPLAQFLGIEIETARSIANENHLFKD